MKLWCTFDLEPKKTEIRELEAESMAEDFWADNRKAQAQMQQLNALREEVTTWESIAEKLNDLHGLTGLLEEEPDEGMQEEVAQDLAAIEQEVERLQFALMLNGEHDLRDAIVSVHAGSGGVEDRKSTRLNSSHGYISYAVFCLKKKKSKIDNSTFRV